MKIGINALYINLTIGTGRYTYNLIKNLNEIDKKNNYIIFSLSCKPAGLRLRENFRWIKVKASFKKPSWTKIWWEFYYLPKSLQKFGVDLNHNPYMTKTSFKNEVVTIHDLVSWRFKKDYQKKLGWKIYYKIISSRIKKAKRIIADSESTKRDTIKFFNIQKEKIKVIHLGTDKKFRKVGEKEKKKIKEKYHLKKFILYIGGTDKRKNILRLIRAYIKLDNKLKQQYNLVIVGKSNRDVEKLIIKEKNIRLISYLSETELILFYNAANLFVYPSLYEGFGLPILEAMACGCPVITSKVSSMPEVAGEAAWLVNPYLVEEIRKGMEKLLENKNLRKELIEKGLKRVKKFNWEKTAWKTLEVYKELEK